MGRGRSLFPVRGRFSGVVCADIDTVHLIGDREKERELISVGIQHGVVHSGNDALNCLLLDSALFTPRIRADNDICESIVAYT